MKASLRKIARNLAGWPGVGRLVRIGVAVVRLPELRDSLEHGSRERASRAQLPPSALAASDYQLFQLEQLPTLLQALSDVNHRQVSEANSHANLTRSVPVALRKMTREIVQLREQNNQLQAQLHEQNNRLQAVLHEASVAADERMAQQAGTGAQTNQLAESVGYLLGRVEFVRRELMFEMRYGASPAGQSGEQLEVTGEILAVDKVEQAHRTGIRLNIGCGHVPLDGYVNVDRRALPGVDVVAEADQLPFEKSEVAEICSTHLLEHFPIEQLRRELLPYWVSLLRSDGVFRAVVPDGAGMARAYVSDEYSFETLRQVTYGGQDYDGDFHYNMFSVESLSQLLREAGLASIEVIAENRENGGCKEFEIVARR